MIEKRLIDCCLKPPSNNLFIEKGEGRIELMSNSFNISHGVVLIN